VLFRRRFLLTFDVNLVSRSTTFANWTLVPLPALHLESVPAPNRDAAVGAPMDQKDAVQIPEFPVPRRGAAGEDEGEGRALRFAALVSWRSRSALARLSQE
jgi:hypothetical protein